MPTSQRETRRDALLAKARTLVEGVKAAGRDLTNDEQAAVDADLTVVRGLNVEIKAERETARIMGALDDQARDVEARQGHLAPGDAGRRLSFSGKAMTHRLANAMLGAGSEKALAPSGAAVTGLEFTNDPVAMGRAATGLLSVLPVVQHETPNFSYLRHTRRRTSATCSVRTNNAAVVADGAVKPTSIYSVVRVDSALAVIAHLSEAVPRFWLQDNAALEQFLGQELQYGLSLAVEAKVLADINATAGLQIQAFATNPLTTLRKSVTLPEAAGYVPAAFVLNPVDWEGVELAISTVNAIEHQGLPYDPATRSLYGIPIAISNAQAAGVSHTLSGGSVHLDTDTLGVAVQWSENSNADDFSKNLIRARCEGRFATSVVSPFGVAKGDLTA